MTDFNEIIKAIPIEPYYRDPQADIVIYCSDCRLVLPLIPDKSIDLVLTDFPYGNNTDYGVYQDDQANLLSLIADIMPSIFKIGKVSLITTGIGNMFSYPHPDWVLSWHWEHTNAGSSHWGFNNWQPILAYGKDPYLTNGLGRRQDARGAINTGNYQDKMIQHNLLSAYHFPCPKPTELWEWIIQRGSVKNTDLILDPFLGSGTTAYCAKKLGRKCIGIEISEAYCKIAQDRLSQSVMRLN